MAGIAVTAAVNREDRPAALAAAKQIRDPRQREEVLRRYKFFEHLAEVCGHFVDLMNRFTHSLKEKSASCEPRPCGSGRRCCAMTSPSSWRRYLQIVL